TPMGADPARHAPLPRTSRISRWHMKFGKDSRVLVAGGNSLIGAALLQELKRQGYNLILNHALGEPDLLEPESVDRYLAKSRPEVIFMAAGRAGGIGANLDAPADLMLDNLLVTCHLLDQACRHQVPRLLYLA